MNYFKTITLLALLGISRVAKTNPSQANTEAVRSLLNVRLTSADIEFMRNFKIKSEQELAKENVLVLLGKQSKNVRLNDYTRTYIQNLYANQQIAPQQRSELLKFAFEQDVVLGMALHNLNLPTTNPQVTLKSKM